jgi:pimeloyl-ACP methyl ester carboxylesterase
MSEGGSVRSGYADVAGARLYYEMAGEGATLVLVHAGIADRRMWDDQWLTFQSKYRVMRYDMRGFGNSPMHPGPFSNRQDLYGLLEFLGIGQAHLIACSMGGMSVIDFALEHPQMVSSMVLISAAVSGMQMQGEMPMQVLEMIQARRKGEFERAADLHVQIWADGFRRGSGHADEKVRERVRQMGLQALSNQAEFLKETGFLTEEPLSPPAIDRLEQLVMPALIMAGDLDDKNVLQTADLLARRLPKARKMIIPGTAHLPGMEKPQEFNRVVLGFLEKNTSFLLTNRRLSI